MPVSAKSAPASGAAPPSVALLACARGIGGARGQSGEGNRRWARNGSAWRVRRTIVAEKATCRPLFSRRQFGTRESLVGKSFLALSERADRGVGWAAAPSSTVSSKVITLPESSASWLSIRAAYGTGTGPLRLEPRVTAPGVEIRHHGGRKVNPLSTALLALVSRAPRER